MSGNAKIAKQLKGWRVLRALISLVVVAFTGCFGPPTMHYDIQEYNKEALSSEEKMLLFNIGRLSQELPPHFMMLSEVAQTRAFSAAAAFQWSQVWNSLFLFQKKAGNATKGTDAYAVGPLIAATSESPTFKFVPIQGNEFGQRFESSLTEQLSLFLEDQRWYATREEREALILLFAQSLNLLHGDEAHGKCGHGLYYNRPLTAKDPINNSTHPPRFGSSELFTCVDQILKSTPKFERIEGRHMFPTTTSEPPKAVDTVSALSAGYRWTTNGKAYVLANPVRIPAYVDYIPWYPPPKPADQQSSDSHLPLWWILKGDSNKPDPTKADFSKLPKNYQWKSVTTDTYALLPDGYYLANDGNGGYKLTRLQDLSPPNEEPLSYSDQIVRDVWPVFQDYFYIELRNPHLAEFPKEQKAGNEEAELVCFTQPDNPNYDPNYKEKYYDRSNSVICGYLKVGNFLQIMQRLAKTACRGESASDACGESIFGIGSKEDIPSWADRAAPYTYRAETGNEATNWVWVPAHDPKREHALSQAYPTHRDLAERDRKAFFTLYKLYQMSLVDTSKLVSGSTPITISK
jgi:hypothetical protein